MAKKENKQECQPFPFTSPAYLQLVAEATAHVRQGQLAAFQAVNKELLQLYWDLGKMTVERQQKHGWGNSVVEMLVSDLQRAYPGMSGFSSRNLWRMRTFFSSYPEFLPPPVAEIGWSHNYVILENCKDPNERLFLYPSNPAVINVVSAK